MAPRWLNPFRFFTRAFASSYLGVDVGTTSIKMVELGRGKDRPVLKNYALLEAGEYLGRTTSALQTSTLKLFEREAVELLRAMRERMKPATTEAVASLPLFSAFMTVLSFPQMPEKELERAFEFQVKQYIPLPLSEVTVDWRKVGSYEDERGFIQEQILLISIPNEHIVKYQNMFRAAGFSLRVLEIENFSAMRALVGSDQTPTAIVDIGSRSTGVSFVEGGELKFAAQTDYAGASLTQALTSSLNINPRRAEELKRDKGIIASGAEYELSTVMLPYLDVIINEVKRADYSYHSQLPQARPIERVLLSGGGANLKGIEKYFKREFNLPVAKAAPLLKVQYPAPLEPVIGELNPVFSVAMGLAMREL